MMSINDDSILLFEYFTASGEKDKCIISEAEALIFSLLDDLKDYDVTVVLNESYKEIMGDYDNVTPIFINEGKDALYPRCCTCPSADAIAECSSAPAIE